MKKIFILITLILFSCSLFKEEPPEPLYKGKYNNLTVRLEWTFEQGARQYEIEILKEDTTTVVLDDTTITTFYVTTLKTGTYFWKVRANIDKDEWSSWSEPVKFTVTYQVELFSPSKDDTLYEPLVFSWRPLEDTRSYHIQISEDSNFSNLTVDTHVYKNYYRVNLIGDYYWRVRPEHISGIYGDWSEIRKVTVPVIVKWKVKLDPMILASPAIGNNNVIYTGRNSLYAINDDGTLKWRGYFWGETEMIASPMIDEEGNIYYCTNGKSQGIHSVTPYMEGHWWYDAGEKILSCPAMDEDIRTIYLTSTYGCLFALDMDAEDYKRREKWRYELGDWGTYSPSIGKDGTIYLPVITGYFLAIDTSGNLKWQLHTESWAASAPSIGSDGTIYFGAGPYMYAVNPDGTLKWKFKAGDFIFSSPAIDIDGTIYFGCDDGYFYALDPQGTLKWRFKAESAIGSSPAISMDGTIYFGNGGYLYALNREGKLKWKIKTGSYIETSPAIDENGVIYIVSTDGYLYAIDDRCGGLASSSWPMFHHDVRHTGKATE